MCVPHALNFKNMQSFHSLYLRVLYISHSRHFLKQHYRVGLHHGDSLCCDVSQCFRVIQEYLWFKGHAIRIRIFAKRACWLRHFSPFVRIYRRVSHWTDFRKTRDCGLCEKSVQKIQILLQSDKNTRQFTRRLKYVSLFPPT